MNYLNMIENEIAKAELDVADLETGIIDARETGRLRWLPSLESRLRCAKAHLSNLNGIARDVRAGN